MAKLTEMTKPASGKTIERNWHLIDVQGKILGRIASEIAYFLMGKHKVQYAPYLDTGDYVVVVNAKKIEVTGRKRENKIYSQYSGYPSGLKETTFKKLLEKRPKEIIIRAVAGMLAKNKLRKKRLARLYVFGDEKHSYEDKFKSKN